MSTVKNLGIAYAWHVGGQWLYLTGREFAPDDAIEVQRYDVDGELVLQHDMGGSGEFIRGATQPVRE